jgi:putative zinc finger/helix-turn-helix YgiT family protein
MRQKEGKTGLFDGVSKQSVRRCVDCGGLATGKVQEYHYTECGLSSVKLSNVTVYRCAACGSTAPEIPAIEPLHTLIAISLLQKEALLSGEEVRFLRKVAGLTQAELAEIMGVHQTRPTKWETDSEPIGKENDRVLRSCCFFGMMRQALSADHPLAGASAAALRAMDIREVFKAIDEHAKPTRPKDIQVGNDPESKGIDGPWFLPEQRTQNQERYM